MSEPRFLCDEMLQRLGRWLRAAGYDTAIATPGSEDHALVARAKAEDRWLITRDRHLARFRNGDGRIVLLDANETAELAAELSARFRIDWLHRPFTRCLDCNTPPAPGHPGTVGASPGKRPRPVHRRPVLPDLRQGLLAGQPPAPDAPHPGALHARRVENSERLAQIGRGQVRSADRRSCPAAQVRWRRSPRPVPPRPPDGRR